MRVAIERILQAAAIVALLWLAWRPELLQPADAVAGAAPVSGATLRAWSRVAADTIALTLDALPAPAERAWLRALRSAGSTIHWSDPGASAVAVTTEPIIDPAGGSRVLLASATSGSATLRDAAGPLDTVAMETGLTAIGTGGLVGPVAVIASRQRAIAAPVEHGALRRALVLGRAGWEARFVIAALEERGWNVDARLAVSPTAAVEQGSWSRPDTSRHALAIVLDSSAAAYAARLVGFVRNGGGLIVAGEASRIPAFAALLPARAAAIVRPTPSAARTDTLGERGARYPLRDLRADAVVLERLANEPTVVARRERNGRVLQLSYAETWRRRMAPADGSVRRHREWWGRVAAAAAFGGPAATARSAESADPAPWLSTRLALGAPSADALRLAPPERELGPMIFTLIVLALLTSWASRRLRGAP